MIYLDNAATSCPKPPEVVEAVTQALSDVCANPSRGAYELSLQAARLLLRTRSLVAELIGVQDESRIIFTLNATHALNLALKGVLRAALASTDERPLHVVTSSLEHNAIARPLQVLITEGFEVTRVRCAPDGTTDPEDIMASLRTNTRLVALSHASNVLGTLLPVADVGPRLRERGVPFLVDAAQTAGCVPIDVEAMGISLLALSGHKGLLGPQGVGTLYVGADVDLQPLVEGGTGSRSESLEQPLDLPDRFEAGTPNTPGIAGLGAGIDVVKRTGIRDRCAHEHSLLQRLRSALYGVDSIRVYGPTSGVACVPLLSLAVSGLTSAEVARVLDREFDIAVRAGLHCAPEAHRVAGTLETGLVRLSIGHATTENDIDRAVQALQEIAGKPPEYWQHRLGEA
jgi:cysteine desulfurase / selenocysteine lyase